MSNLVPIGWSSKPRCKFKKKNKVCGSCVSFSRSIVESVSALGQAVNLTKRCKHVAVSACMPAQRYVCKHTVWGDDMCYFACKFFSNSPPSEPAESDSGAGLKTEVCFYD